MNLCLLLTHQGVVLSFLFESHVKEFTMDFPSCLHDVEARDLARRAHEGSELHVEAVLHKKGEVLFTKAGAHDGEDVLGGVDLDSSLTVVLEENFETLRVAETRTMTQQRVTLGVVVWFLRCKDGPIDLNAELFLERNVTSKSGVRDVTTVLNNGLKKSFPSSR